MNKSTSSSSLIIIHDGIPQNVNLNQESSSMIEKSNDLMNQLNNDLSDNECNVDKSDIDKSYSNSNNYSSSNDSSSEDIDFDVHLYSNDYSSSNNTSSEDIDFDVQSYQFKIETNYLSTYEDEWPGSRTNESENEYNIELGMLKFPINLLQENISVVIIQLKEIQLSKMNENINDIAIYKYYDIMQNKRITTNAKFELVSPKTIIVNHGNYSWLNDFQSQSFDVWKNNIMSNELITNYNKESVN